MNTSLPEDFLRARLDARQALWSHWTEDVRERARLQRLALAKELDLPISALEPVRPSAAPAAPKPSGTSWLPAACAVGLTTAGLGVGGAWLLPALTAASAMRAVAEPQAPAPREFQIRWWLEDGELRSEAKPLANDAPASPARRK